MEKGKGDVVRKIAQVEQTKNQNKLLWLLGGLIATFIAFALFYIFFGKVQYDEGFYLYASKIAWLGRIPYRDFFFTQTPLLPYVYGLPQHLLGTSLYLGRLTSLLFGILSVFLIYAIAYRMETRFAGLVAVALFIFNLETIYMETIVLTTALSVFLILLASLVLVSKINDYSKAILSVAILIVATGVRASVAPIILVFLLFFWMTKGWRVFLAGLIAALVAGLAIWSPFYLLSKGAVLFDVFGSHVTKEPIIPLPKILYIIWAIGQTTLLYFAQAALGLLLLTAFIINQGARGFFKRLKKDGIYLVFGSAVILVSLVHFIPTQARYPTYEALVMPLVSIIVAGGVDRVYRQLQGETIRRIFLSGVIILILLIPLAQVGHMVDISGGQSPIAEIRGAASFIKDHSNKDDFLLTFDSYLAIEAQRAVPPGLEMSIFSYFPTWSTAKAEKYKVVNNEILLNYVRNKQPKVIALTEFDRQRILRTELSTLYYFEAFRYRRPRETGNSRSGQRLLNAINQDYYLAKEFPLYGQYSDTLYVYLKREGR